MGRIKIARHGNQDSALAEQARKEGYAEGKVTGRTLGYEEGRKTVEEELTRARTQATLEGQRDGYNRGRAEETGYADRKGYERGYDEGLRRGWEDVNQARNRTPGIQPQFKNGWDAALEMVKQHMVLPDEMAWFEGEFKQVIVPDALEVLAGEINKT